MADEVTPKDDIVADFFGDNKETTTTETTTENKDGKTETTETTETKETKTDEKVDVGALVRETTKAVMAEVKPLLQGANSNTARQRQFDKWLSSQDGKMFGQYADFLEQAANDPRYQNLSIAQLPGAILKPSAYAKVLSDAKTAADAEAKDSKAGGTSGRSSGGTGDEAAPDYKNMSREDFKKTMDENKSKIKRR